MRGVIIKRRSLVRDALDWLGAGIPNRLVRWWRGPVSSVEIGADGLGKKVDTHSLRPVDVEVAPEAMLTMRLTIPKAGRHELRHAVALAIRQDTPFEPDELVVQAIEVKRAAETETYVVQAVPKRLINDAVRRIGHLRLARISVGEVGGPDLSVAMFPWRRARAWLSALPLVIIAGIATAGAYGTLTDQDQQAATLEQQMAAAISDLRRVSGELEAIEAKALTGSQITAAIAAAPPVFLLLERARRVLPATTEVMQIELREGQLRLALRTDDALGDMASFIDAGWQAAIDGAITADPGSRREIAVLRLSQARGTP